MKKKICGMRDAENIEAVAALSPDFLGFIFYNGSKRFVGDDFDAAALARLPKGIKKIGVFVNENIENILAKAKKYDLQGAQLHGDESPEFCEILRQKSSTILGAEWLIIKVFSVAASADFVGMSDFEPHCDYFLLDTKGTERGGNGVVFDWSVLEKYPSEKPFFLSGGLNPENIKTALALRHHALFGLDVNSGFEVAPALKNVALLRVLVEGISVEGRKADVGLS